MALARATSVAMPGDALDLLGRDQRAAREPPHAAVNHADAEPVRLGRVSTTESAAAAKDLPVAHANRLHAVACEPDVRIRTAETFGFRKRDRGPLAVFRIAHRRGRFAHRIEGPRKRPRRRAGDDGAGAERLQEMAARSRHSFWRLADRHATMRSSTKSRRIPEKPIDC
jgi:hypothetical protein